MMTLPEFLLKIIDNQKTSESAFIPGIQLVLDLLTETHSDYNKSQVFEVLLEIIMDSNRDDLVQAVLAQIILPESNVNHEQRVYSTDFFSYMQSYNYEQNDAANNIYYRLCTQLSKLMGNNFSIRSNNTAHSIECFLSSYPWGRKLINAAVFNNPSLASIYLKTTEQGTFQGVSVALNCLMDIETRLEVIKNGNAFLDESCLNTVVQANGDYTGRSVAYRLARCAAGRALLTSNEGRLAKLINAQCLNSIVPNGPHPGGSLAYLFAINPDLVKSNNVRLEQLINENSLNSVIQSGPDAGLSTAHALMRCAEGRRLLNANNARLLNLINTQCFNSIVPNNTTLAGTSVAYFFARHITSFLSSSSIFLQHINEDSLNSIVPNDSPRAGTSAAYWLATSPEGRALLRSNNGRLEKLINETCRHSVVKNNAGSETSVAYCLAPASRNDAAPEPSTSNEIRANHEARVASDCNQTMFGNNETKKRKGLKSADVDENQPKLRA